ncbi:MAG: hypothetical protein ACYTDY_14685, partial [Planctomycetota bacterium]
LRTRGVSLAEGGHSVYVPPQPALREVLPEPAAFYPEGAGFKILKDLRGPAEATYLTGGSRRALRVRATGRPVDQIVAANYMHSLGIGPRIWDVAALRGDGGTYTMFVVDHIEGRPPRPEESEGYLETLSSLLTTTELRVLVPRWREHVDFALPGCGDNLVVPDDGRGPQYVDFQNFGLRDTRCWTRAALDRGVGEFHFGGTRPGRGSRYLYQSVPGVSARGKRNTERRWDLIRRAFEVSGLAIENRVVLDVGCNAGMVLYAALVSGASWALGWDLPGVARAADELLLSLGLSRFHVFGRELSDAYDLRDDVPEGLVPRLRESVVFYLAVREHIGWMDCLGAIPWRVLVYEGHQGEGEVDVAELMALSDSNDLDVVLRTSAADGDCSARPIAVVVRR